MVVSACSAMIFLPCAYRRYDGQQGGNEMRSGSRGRRGGRFNRAVIQFPIDTSKFPTARRLQISLLCPKCGQQSVEPLSGLDGRYAKACRHCNGRITLTDENNRILIEQLVKICMDIDFAR